jgi:hypothetical protein
MGVYVILFPNNQRFVGKRCNVSYTWSGGMALT